MTRSKKKGAQKPGAAPPPAAATQQPAEDLYASLGLERACSVEDIKRAYRTHALRCHPDKNPSPEAQTEFQRISFAYSVLSDTSKRAFYDKHGAEGLDVVDMPAEEFLRQFQDMFAEMLGGVAGIKAMLKGMSKREISRLPPFPFPKELFPPGTFPEGLRFSTQGLAGMPPSVEELLASGGDGLANLADMFTTTAPPHPTRTTSHTRAAGGAAGRRAARTRGGRRQPHAFGFAPGLDTTFTHPFDPSFDAASLDNMDDAMMQQMLAQVLGVPPEALGDLAGLVGDLNRLGSSGSGDNDSQSDSEGWVTDSDDGSCDGEGEIKSCSGATVAGSQHSAATQTGSAQARAVGQQEVLGACGTGHAGVAEPRGTDGGRRTWGSGATESPPADARAAPARAASAGGAGPSDTLTRDWMAAAKVGDVGVLSHMLASQPGLLGVQGNVLGHTALHWSAARGHVDAARWLLARGADAAARNHEGATPLHAAARNGQGACVQALLECGVCDVGARDGEGETAADLAVRFAHHGVAALLHSHTNSITSTSGTILDPAISHPTNIPQSNTASDQPSTSAHTPQPAPPSQHPSAEQTSAHTDLRVADTTPRVQPGTEGSQAPAVSRAGDSSTQQPAPFQPQPQTPQHADTSAGPDARQGASRGQANQGGAACSSEQPAGPAASTLSEGASQGPSEQGQPACSSEQPAAGATEPAVSSSSSQPAASQQKHQGHGSSTSTRASGGGRAQSSNSAGSQGGANQTGSADRAAAERAARRDALLAAQQAADEKEEQEERDRERAGAAAAAAIGVLPAQGKVWLDSAKAGRLTDLQRLLAANPALLHYQGQGTNYSFVGSTALHWCAAKGHLACLRWLLGRGARVAQANSAGAYPLHAAVTHEHLDVIQVLILRAGADAQAPDALGDTPRDLALRKGPSSDALVRHLDLLTHTHTLATTDPSTWGARAMRRALALAGIDSTGVLERNELVAMTDGLVKGLMQETQPIEMCASASAASQQDACALPTPVQAVEAPHTTAAHVEVLVATQPTPDATKPAQDATKPASGGTKPQGATNAASPMGQGKAKGGLGSPKPSGRIGTTVEPSDGADECGNESSGESESEGEGECDASVRERQVEMAKAKGNQAFAAKDFQKAISHYTMAIRLCKPPRAVLYLNRAAAYASIQHYVKSLEDADEAVRLEPALPKAHSRRGAALLGSRRYEDAASAFEQALRLDPEYSAAMEGLQEAQWKLREQDA